MDEATSAIDVKDLLAAAPVQAPTLEQLTTELDAEGAVSASFHACLVLCRRDSAPEDIRDVYVRTPKSWQSWAWIPQLDCKLLAALPINPSCQRVYS